MKFDSFKRDVFSQNGEDGILEAILDLIPKQDLRKLVVEFGAWDGINFSNTYSININFIHRIDKYVCDRLYLRTIIKFIFGR